MDKPQTNRATPQHSQARKARANTGQQYRGVPTFTVDPATGEQVETVGQEERCDPTFEKHETDERNELWVEQRRVLNEGLRSRRASMPLHELLYGAMAEAARITTVGGNTRLPGDEREQVVGGKTATDDNGSPGGTRPAHGDDALTEHPDVKRRLALIRGHADEIWRLIDAHRGIASSSDFALMGPKEKDKTILERFIGQRPEEVSEQYPELGSPRTIRRVREKADVRGVCGHEKGEECACGRRAA